MKHKLSKEERKSRITDKINAIIAEAKRLNVQFEEEHLLEKIERFGNLDEEKLRAYGGFASSEYFRFAIPVWAGEATVSVSFRGDEHNKLGLNADVSVSWSSTGRSVAQAISTVKLYQQATEFAALVEAVFQG